MYLKNYLVGLGLVSASAAMAITPNPLLTRDSLVYTGDGATNTYITDGTLTNWKSCTSKTMAFHIGEGPTRLRIDWESFGDDAWATTYTTGCSHYGTAMSTFKIMTSANTTDGYDGDWTEAASVTDNPVMARGVEIDFEGQSWFKIVSDGDVGQILEVEAFDISKGGDDTWFFMGTSISQMGLKQQETDTTTADLIHARFPQYTPSMLRGGIGCINSTEVVAHINDYLQYAGNVHFWAIEMGTNDCWGGGDWNLENYKNNMQTIIDSAKAHGITPILARIIATDSAKAGWQVNPKYLDAVDELTEKNNLPAGPDFYTYFHAHPELISTGDGVHPKAETGGGQAMHHLWAEALAPLYANADTSAIPSSVNQAAALTQLRVYTDGHQLVVYGLTDDAVADLYTYSGHLVDSRTVSGSPVIYDPNQAAGMYLLNIRSANAATTVKVLLK